MERRRLAVEAFDAAVSPEELMWASYELTQTTGDLSAQARDRLPEVLPQLPASEAGALAHQAITSAWVAGERDEAVRWFHAAGEAAARCTDPDWCPPGCARYNLDHAQAVLQHQGVLDPQTERDRVLLALTTCRERGVSVPAIEPDARFVVVAPDHPLGVCVGEVLGAPVPALALR